MRRTRSRLAAVAAGASWLVVGRPIYAAPNPAEAAKAAQLGIPLIASRTSPTDKAVQLCEEAGITLIGYVRGGRFTVYSHPERLMVAEEL